MTYLRCRHRFWVKPTVNEHQTGGRPCDESIRGPEGAEGQEFAVHYGGNDDRRCSCRGEQQPHQAVETSRHLQRIGRGTKFERIVVPGPSTR